MGPIPGCRIKIPCAAWHGQKVKDKRNRSLLQFCKGILLCTLSKFFKVLNFTVRSISSGQWASPWWLGGKESAYNANVGSIPGLGRFPAKGNGNPLQYSSLGNPMDKGAWWAAVHKSRKESDKTEATEHTYTYVIKYFSTAWFLMAVEYFISY